MGRAKTRLPDFVNSAEETCGDRNNVVYSFMLHEGDTETEEYIKDRLPEERLSLHYESLESPHLAKFWNRLYEETKFQDKRLMVSMVGDDMVFQSQWWDDLLLDECNKHHGLGVWFGDDCKNTHDALMVNIFTTRRIVDGQRPFPFMCEAFPCDDMDWVWDHVTRRLGIRYYLPEFKLFHNHATFVPGNKDNVWERLRTVWPQVEKERKNMEIYVSERCEALKKNIPELTKTKPTVLFACMGRYGDVIHASLHANRLISMGYDITWLTIPMYASLVNVVSPDSKVLLFNNNDSAWEAITYKTLREYQGYCFYINAQPGAPEYHDLWVGTGKSMMECLSDIVRDSLSSPMMANGVDNKYIQCLPPINDYGKYALVRGLPCPPVVCDCIVAPEIISTTAIWPEGGLEGVIKKYKPDLVLTKKCGYSFLQCISIIRACKLFIGQDSGLAWAALYSNCKKIIYHTKKRISETNMLFSKLNNSYEDVIL